MGDIGCKITISKDTLDLLYKDFSSFKLKSVNDLYNRIIHNYYEDFSKKYIDTKNDIKDVLNKYKVLNNKNIEKTIEDIIDSIRLYSYSDYHDINDTEVIKITITKTSLDEYNLIRKENKKDSLSNYLRRMFDSYASFPAYFRETIIFKDRVDIINKAIVNNKAINVKIEKDKVFNIYPYTIQESKIEAQTYLLGIMKNKNEKDVTKKYVPISIRLSIIKDIKINNELFFEPIRPLSINIYDKIIKDFPTYLNNTKNSIFKEEKDNYYLCSDDIVNDLRIPKDLINKVVSIIFKLNIMKNYCPNYAYTTSEGLFIKVKLTEAGDKNLHNITIGKPFEIDKKDKEYMYFGNELEIKEKGEHIFLCSKTQAYLYFLKFGKDVIDVEPKEIKDKLNDFHGINDKLS